MAVLAGLEGIEVTVRVDNQALHEYNNDEVSKQPGAIGEYQASRTVSKYIEAVTGKEFTIAVTVRAPYKIDCPSLVFEMMVDGNVVDKPLLRKLKYRRKNWERNIAGIRHQLEAEDETKLCSIKDDAKRIGEVGEISVWVFRKSESIMSQKIANYSLKSGPVGAVHEKALKGQSKFHGTSLGAAQPAEADRIYRSEYLDGFDKSIGIFRFKYRSREALRSLLIIERTPEPEAAREEKNAQATTAATQTLKSDNEAAAGTPSTTSTPTRSSTNPLTTLTPPATPSSTWSVKKEHLSSGATIKDEESKEGVWEGGTSPERLGIKREGGESEPSRRTRKRHKFIGKVTIDLTEVDDEEERMRNAITIDDD